MEEVVRDIGGYPITTNFTMNVSTEYDQFLYSMFESGFPVILGIHGWDIRAACEVSHVVAVLGHTLNIHRFVEASHGYGCYPIEEYIPVSEWCDHIIINDDNFGMYVDLPSDMLRNVIVPRRNPRVHAGHAMGILPEPLELSGFQAEQFAVDVAKFTIEKIYNDKRALNNLSTRASFWIKILHEAVNLFTHSSRLVFRTFCTKKNDYIEYLRRVCNNSNIFSKYMMYLNTLPDRLWISEISLPDIYVANHDKLGDVVLPVNIPEESKKSDGLFFSLIWIPGCVCFGSGQDIKEWFIEDHVEYYNFEI